MDKSKSNYSLRDVFQTKKMLKESSAFHSEVCIERADYDKSNDNLDYDSVIKQFDELISELSCASNTKDRTISLSKNLTLENEDFVSNRQNSKNESACCDKTCDKDFSINKKSLHCNSSSKVAAASSKDRILSVDLDSKIYASKPNYSYLTDITPTKKNLNENSFPDVKKSMPWINSHLWNLDKKSEPLLFHKHELEANTKISADDFKLKIKGNYFNSSQFMTTIPPQTANAFNASYFLKQQQQEFFSNSKSDVKCNSKTFSYGGSPLQEKHLCPSKLAFASGKFFILLFVYGMYLVCHKCIYI